ncbi:MAG: hypothetical protein EKK61_01435 [Rickettsiales bacterium]|nr:MAG: hypothetical protein EKK61_01435 [Rickettsiales bacterium]
MKNLFIVTVVLFLSSCSASLQPKNISINQLKEFEKQNQLETGLKSNKYVKEEIEKLEKAQHPTGEKVEASNSKKDITTGKGYVTRGFYPDSEVLYKR